MLKTVFQPAPKSSDRLLIALHGLGDCKESYQDIVTAMGIEDLNCLAVDAPDEYYGGYSWFDYYGGDPIPGIIRSRKLLAELLDRQREEGFPTERTYLLGFSQGCLMTIEMGARYPHLFAGLIGISGKVAQRDVLLSERSEICNQQRFLITHGHFDPVIPFAPVKDDIHFLKNHGFNITWKEYPKDHTIYGREELGDIRDFIQSGPAPSE